MTVVGGFAVYIMASRKHGTLYIGVTSELLKRVSEHREGQIDGFTKRYGVKRLVWFEPHGSIVMAIQRETSLKRYNPDWDDLFPQFFSEDGPLSHLQPREPSK